MDRKTFFVATSVVFSLVTIVHALRIIRSWEAVIGGFTVPIWVSWLAVVIAGTLAYQSFKLGK